MAVDKRTILSSKRARNRRRKALRASAKLQPDVDNAGDQSSPLTETSSGDDEEEEDALFDDDELVFVCRPTMPDFCTEFVPVTSNSNSSNSSQGASAVVASTMKKEKEEDTALDWRRFGVRIPAFRETRDGYVTYSITVTVVTPRAGPRRQFQLERRYSEFVSFAHALESYWQSPEYQRWCKDRRGVPASNSTPHQDDEEGKDDDLPAPSSQQEQPLQWELPPKTWLRMTQVTALEERRAQLEDSLQTLLAHEQHAICEIPLVRDFLLLDIFGAQVVEDKLQEV